MSTPQVELHLDSLPPEDDGTVRGALTVKLAQGWHTYWIDPGASGIAPNIDFSAMGNVGQEKLRFPAPTRFGEGMTRTNGYQKPFAIAFELLPQSGRHLGPVHADVLIGVCRDICIPVQASLTAATSSDGTKATVAEAFDALPPKNGSSEPTIMSVQAAAGEQTLTVDVAVKDAARSGDVFVTGPDGWIFDEPNRPAIKNDQLEFTVPIVERPSHASDAPGSVDVVFTSADGSVAADDVPVTKSAP